MSRGIVVRHESVDDATSQHQARRQVALLRATLFRQSRWR